MNNISPIENKQYMTISETAKYLNLTSITVLKLCRLRKIICSIINKKIYIRKSDIQDYLKGLSEK